MVVEHDADVMRAADHIIDLGPGAGEHGGQRDLRRLLSQDHVADGDASLTSRYLRGELQAALPADAPRRWIRSERS